MTIIIDDALTDCLLWFAHNEGAAISREALLDGLPLDSGKLSAALLTRAAERADLHISLVKQSLSGINHSLLPAMLLLQQGRACVLLSVDADNDQCEVLLPELGMQPEQMMLSELAKQFTGVVVYCRKIYRVGDKPMSEDIEHFNGHWFWSVIKSNRKIYRDVLVAAFFINLFALTMPIFVMNVYDRVVPNQALETLWVLAIGVGIVVMADLILRLLRSWFIELAAQRTDVTVSAKIMERALGMKLEHAPASVGSYAANISAFESIRSFIGSMVVTALIDLPFFLLFVLIIALISGYMALPVLVGAAVVILYALSVQKRLHHLSDISMQAGSQRNAVVVESLAVAPTLKAFNASSRSQKLWEQATIFISSCTGKQRTLGSSVGSVASWFQQLVSVGLIIIGVYLVVNGELTQGGLIAAYMLCSRAMAPITQTASLLTQYHSAATAMKSLEQMMQIEQERDLHKVTTQMPKLNGDIEFRHVSFTYPGDERPVLNDVTFSIKQGEKVGILGRIGSGKSTVEKLIMGLYQPTVGDIFLDGRHLNQLDIAEVRRHIGFVSQDIQLVNGTVYENITLGTNHLDPQRLQQAINLAGLAPWLGKNAQGLSLPVGENGRSLSGGQRQGIAIARAFYGDRSVILLDEPTSAMDSMMENHVKQELDKQADDKTLILVTHRPSLLTLVDRLIILDEGRILADGPKDAVLQDLEQGRIRRVA